MKINHKKTLLTLICAMTTVLSSIAAPPTLPANPPKKSTEASSGSQTDAQITINQISNADTNANTNQAQNAGTSANLVQSTTTGTTGQTTASSSSSTTASAGTTNSSSSSTSSAPSSFPIKIQVASTSRTCKGVEVILNLAPFTIDYDATTDTADTIKTKIFNVLINKKAALTDLTNEQKKCFFPDTLTASGLTITYSVGGGSNLDATKIKTTCYKSSLTSNSTPPSGTPTCYWVNLPLNP